MADYNMSDLSKQGVYSYSPSTEYRDNYGGINGDRGYIYAAQHYNQRQNLKPSIRKPGRGWGQNEGGYNKQTPLSQFVPRPLPFPEPVEPYMDPWPYSRPTLGGWLPHDPMGAYSTGSLSYREPLPSYLSFSQSRDYEKLMSTPSSRYPIFPGERRVDGMRAWMDLQGLDGHVACDGLCPYSSGAQTSRF